MSADATADGRGNVIVSFGSSLSQLEFLNEVHFNVWTHAELSLEVADSVFNPVKGWRENCSMTAEDKYQTSRVEVTAMISDGNATFSASILQIVGNLVSAA